MLLGFKRLNFSRSRGRETTKSERTCGGIGKKKYCALLQNYTYSLKRDIRSVGRRVTVHCSCKYVYTELHSWFLVMPERIIALPVFVADCKRVTGQLKFPPPHHELRNVYNII